jgi:hypothetical protein
LAIGEVVKKPTAQVNNLYKKRKRKDTNFNATKKITPVGRKKAPNWKKKCFQLDKFFFPTGNPVLGGYSHFNAHSTIFPFQGIRKTVKDKVKRFDKRRPSL